MFLKKIVKSDVNGFQMGKKHNFIGSNPTRILRTFSKEKLFPKQLNWYPWKIGRSMLIF